MLAGVLLSLFSATSFAANTAANTSISNLATVNYSVGGVGQTAIGKLVYRLVQYSGRRHADHLSWCGRQAAPDRCHPNDAAGVAVTPGQTGAVLVYKVTNNGNARPRA